MTNEKRRILVDDDEGDILELLGEYLATRGFEVYTAADANEALDIFTEHRVPIVLSDLKMAETSGLGLLKSLKQLPSPSVVILMTGYGTVDTAVSAMRSGAFDYIQKPFRLRDLYALIGRAEERLNRDRSEAIKSELLVLYDTAHGLKEPYEIPRLIGILVGVIKMQHEASEVGLWFKRSHGWDGVSRVGNGALLGRFDPSEVQEMALENGLLVAPLFLSGEVAAVIAIGGSTATGDDVSKGLESIVRLVEVTLARVLHSP